MRWPWQSCRDGDDAALDEEIRTHLAMAVADRIARGEAPDAAAAAARREFGNVGHVKEVTRETWGGLWLERLAQDARYAIRSLRRAPMFTTVAILTLGLGIGVNTAMFTIVRGILLRPLPFASPDQLYLVSHEPEGIRSLLDYVMADWEYLDFRGRTKTFATVAAYNAYPATFLGAGEPLRVATASVSGNFFNTLGARAAIGRVFRADDEHPGSSASVIIGHGLWRDRFGGDSAVIGRSVHVEGFAKTIVGIMPEGFDFPQHTEVWTPLVIQLNANNSQLHRVIGRLAPGATVAAARAELRTFAADEERIDTRRGQDRFTSGIIPLRESIVGNVRLSLLIFAGAVGLVLLIACVNVSNLMLVRASTRAHELGVRAALGAGRGRLLRQLLTESCIVGVAGGLVGLAIAYAGVRLVLAAAPPDLLPREREIHVDLMVLVVALVTCIGAGVLSGIAPAINASRRDLRDALSETGRTTARLPLQAIFVTVETALALLLLIGAGLLLRSFERLRSVDLGFVPDNLVTVTLDFPHTRYQTTQLLHDVQTRISARIAGIEGVRSSAAVNWIPLSNSTIMGDFSLEDGRKLPPGYIVLKPCVTSDYFATMGIPIREGRGFLRSEGAGTPRVVIISKGVAARLWPGTNPLGKRITMADHPQAADWMTIVGIVDDVVQQGVAQPRDEAVYQLLPQVDQWFFVNHINFVVRTDDAHVNQVAQGIRTAVREIDPEQPIESVMTMTSRLGAVIAEPRFRSLLLAAFAALAVCLAAVGVYGVLAYGVTARTRELSIRMALGASPRAVVSLVMANSATLAIPGLLLGLAASLGATRVLSSFLFQVRAIDPITFGGATVLLLTVSLVAAYVPARRAGKVDPVLTIK